MTSLENILILGIGNPLMGDEGIGVRIAEELLRNFDFPENVEVIDAGTMGLGMLHLFKNRDHILVVDAVDGTGHEPGTIVTLSPEDIAPNQIMHSLHDMRFVNVLEAAQLTGVEPSAECVGVQITKIEPWTTDLSEALEEAIPSAVSAVLDKLEEMGVKPTPRTERSTEASLLEAIRTHSDATED